MSDLVDCDGNCGDRIEAGIEGFTVHGPDDYDGFYFCSLRCMDSWLSSEL